MKTKNNQVVAAAFFTLIMIGGNVNAKGTELNASSFETIKETALEVENWMVNENYWNKSDVAFYIDEVAEESLELEGWMIDKNSWENQDPYIVENETDNDLNLEGWMINEYIWNRK